jgi:hypothetical protein
MGEALFMDSHYILYIIFNILFYSFAFIFWAGLLSRSSKKLNYWEVLN